MCITYWFVVCIEKSTKPSWYLLPPLLLPSLPMQPDSYQAAHKRGMLFRAMSNQTPSTSILHSMIFLAHSLVPSTQIPLSLNVCYTAHTCVLPSASLEIFRPPQHSLTSHKISLYLINGSDRIISELSLSLFITIIILYKFGIRIMNYFTLKHYKQKMLHAGTNYPQPILRSLDHSWFVSPDEGPN